MLDHHRPDLEHLLLGAAARLLEGNRVGRHTLSHQDLAARIGLAASRPYLLADTAIVVLRAGRVVGAYEEAWDLLRAERGGADGGCDGDAVRAL